ncbi:MAG: nitrous oxide reductase accessory protein NosL [Nitrospirae bacterium]|nr:nitrous oxide reductase accessory protein NosL [Nitrospirota bacterium]
MRRVTIAILLSILAFHGVSVSDAADTVIFPAKGRCIECGMKVAADSPFSSAMIKADGAVVPFCDIGDMLAFRKDGKVPANARLMVRDYMSREWITAGTAFFVKNAQFHSPMGWGIAAFKDRNNAAAIGSAMTLDEAMKALK